MTWHKLFTTKNRSSASAKIMSYNCALNITTRLICSVLGITLSSCLSVLNSFRLQDGQKLVSLCSLLPYAENSEIIHVTHREGSDFGFVPEATVSI